MVTNESTSRRRRLAYTEPHYTVNNNAAVVQERERKLQTNLINKIDRFLRGDTDGFALTLMNEAQRLSEAAYGSAFLHTIGSVRSTSLLAYCYNHLSILILVTCVIVRQPSPCRWYPNNIAPGTALGSQAVWCREPRLTTVIVYISICLQADVCRLVNAWIDLQQLCYSVLVNTTSHQPSSSLFVISPTHRLTFFHPPPLPPPSPPRPTT